MILGEIRACHVFDKKPIRILPFTLSFLQYTKSMRSFYYDIYMQMYMHLLQVYPYIQKQLYCGLFSFTKCSHILYFSPAI